MDCSMPGFPVHHHLLEPTQTHVHHVDDAIQPSHPLSSPSPPLSSPSPPVLNLSGIRIFSNESVLHIRWPKYWSFSFSISPSNTTVQKHQFFGAQLSLWSNSHIHTSVQFSSVTRSCPTLCNPMDHSTPSFPVHHQLPELA